MNTIKFIPLSLGLFFIVSVASAKPGVSPTSSFGNISSKTPLLLTENQGQVADSKGQLQLAVLFTAHSGNTQVFITANGISYQFTNSTHPSGHRLNGKDPLQQDVAGKEINTQTHRFSLSLEGANPSPHILREEKSAYTENFFLAHCRAGITGVPTYGRVTLQNIYAGIDWVIYSNAHGLKYDFIVHPGADPHLIQLKVKDANSVSITPGGELLMKTSLGEVREHAPESFSCNRPVRTAFKQLSDGMIGFETGAYNKDETLRIDPSVAWATYYGATGVDFGTASAVDAYGNVYMSGGTTSASNMASGGLQTSYGGTRDAYIVKFNSSGNRLWATYYGGSGDDRGLSCTVDAAGSIYMSGSTNSAGLASGGAQNTFGGIKDAFLVKMTNSGGLLWSTYYGGAATEDGSSCTTDALGNVYLAGTTTSSTGISFNGFQNSMGGNSDAYLVKFNGNNGTRIWGTYYGGAGTDKGYSCSVDGTGKAYLAGETSSGSNIASGGAQNTLGGQEDGFLVKFSNSGVRLWGTYYGGSGSEDAYSSAVDSSGNVYVAGSTNSSTGIATGGFQNTLVGTDNAYLVKFNNAGTRLWGTYYGRSGLTIGAGCATDFLNNVYLSGYTSSVNGISAGGIQNAFGGGIDAFLVKFNALGNRVWGSYYGGSLIDHGTSCTTDNVGNLYLTGVTNSINNISSGGFQNNYNSSDDAFLVKILNNSCSQDTINLNTGLDSNSTLLNVNTPDPYWHTTQPIVNKVDVPNGSWGSLQNAQWLGDQYAPVAIYVYTRTVSIPSPAMLEFTTMGDNFVTILLDGDTLAQTTAPGGGLALGYLNANAVSYAGNVPAGAHTFTAVIHNGLGPCGFIFKGSLIYNTAGNTVPTPGTITGNDSICYGLSQTYSVLPVTGASSYTWTLPNGWTGSSITNTINVTPDSSNGVISVTANNICTSSTPKTMNVTIQYPPAQPGIISGTFTVCAGVSQTYSVAPVVWATSYTWTLPSGWTGTSTTNSITTIPGNISDTIRVIANNACGSSIARTRNVTTKTIPAQPGTISGNVTVCVGTNQTYSLAPVAGATSYTWTLPGATWTGTSTTTSIATTAGSTSGTITVMANNNCGNSAPQTMAIATNIVPAQPGFIAGNATVCSGTNQTYSITPVAGATSYTWTLPGATWTGTSTSASIATIAGTTAGTISVTANNACGSSAPQTFAINFNNTPAQPGTISGNATVCSGTTQTYSIAPVAGATSYTWTLPGATWTGTSTTTSIGTTASSTSGTITVMANNNCGNSAPQTMAIATNTVPAQPGIIAGNATVCAGTNQTYSIAPIAGATSYTWTLPGATWTGTSTTTSIATIVGTTSGTITLTANNACGSSAPQTLAINFNNPPAQPGAISGNATVCSGTAQTYSIAPVAGATSYTWTLPGTTWTGTSTSASIATIVGSTSGSISVTANNACGSSTPQTLAINFNNPPAQPGTISGATAVCAGASQTYSIAPIAGATSYTWTLPGTTWTGTSTTTSIATIVGTTSGTITLTANNACGSSAPQTLAINFNNPPAQPGTISGNATVCSGTNQTYSIVSVAGATSYTWTLPGATWTGTSSTTSIATIAGTTSGSISVTANNVCGSSTPQTLAINFNNPPAQPSAISGNAIVCSGTTQTYSIAPVAGATSYTWTLPGATWTGTSTTTSIATTIGTTSGTISVTANNACGSSTPQTLAINFNNAPVQPGTISGNATVCSGTTQTYSIAPVAGATSYTWTLPGATWTGTSTTASIATIVGTTSGTISATANNACGISTPQTLAINFNNPPAQPGVISGNATVCSGTNQTYSITPVAGAISYTWTLPGATWTGSSTTTSIATMAGSTAGNISVTANNACGSSAPQTLAINFNNAPVQPGTISGATTVCAGASQSYSIAPVAGATSYTWTLPGTTWTGSSTSASILATVGNTAGNIIVTANNACGSSAPRSLAATVNNIPPTPGSITGNMILCAGSATTYTIAPVSSATSYTWNLPPGWIGTSNTNNINGTCGTSGMIYVYANNICGTSGSAQAMVQVDPNVVPGININTIPPTTLCAGTPITFITNIAGGGNTPQYQWFKNGVLLPGAIGANYTDAALNNQDTITAILISSAVCASTSTANSNAVGVTVDSMVVPTVTIAVSPGTHISSGQLVVFTASITHGGSTPNFQWTKNGLPIPFANGSTYTSYTLMEGDVIDVTLTSSAPCATPIFVTAAPVTMHIGTGTGTIRMGSAGITLHPNPNNGHFTLSVQWDVPVNERVRISIVNSVGQEIYNTELLPERMAWSLPIWLSDHIASGMYVLQLQSSVAQAAKPFIINR